MSRRIRRPNPPWPVSSKTMIPVLIVFVAPEVSAAAPTTAKTPGAEDGRMTCASSPKRRPAVAPRTKSGMKSPQGMGREIERTVVTSLTAKKTQRESTTLGDDHAAMLGPPVAEASPPEKRSLITAWSVLRV